MACERLSQLLVSSRDLWWPGAVRKRLQDAHEVSDRDALSQQPLQHPLHFTHCEQVGHDLVDEARVLLFELVEEFATSCRPSNSGAFIRIISVRCVATIDGGSTTVYPASSASSRLPRQSTWLEDQRQAPPFRCLRSWPWSIPNPSPSSGRAQFTLAYFDSFDLDRIDVRIELHIVTNSDRRNDEAQFEGHLPPDHRDAVEQIASMLCVDERMKPIRSRVRPFHFE